MSKRKRSGKAKYAPFYLRNKVYERDAGQCQYCGLEMEMKDCNIDHVIPRGSHRGKTTAKNLVVVCRSCNELKGWQLIPEELRPRRGEAFRSRKQIREGFKTEDQKEASQRMKDRISVIREASAMGIELDDLFTEGDQERWR